MRLRPGAALIRLIVGGGVAALVAWLMLFRLVLYPSPWFDEGLNVSTAAMLVREGLYALPDSAGPRVLDPAIQTGPTVLVPVALVFRLFGVGLVQARVVIVVLSLLALVAYALVARRLVGTAGMLVAILLLLAGNREPFASFVVMSRQVLGEVPALGFYLLGLLVWQLALDQSTPSWPGLIFSGVAWGTAMVTKPQMLLLLPVCLGLLALLNGLYYRQVGWRAFLVPGLVAMGCVITWYLIQIAIVGPAQFLHNAQVLDQGFALHIVSIDPAHRSHALGVIWRTGFWIWGVPALAWGLWQARHRSRRSFDHSMALALPVIGLLWFAGLSIGWSRYMFYPLTLTPIWLAGLLVDLGWGSFRFSPGAGRPALIAALISLYTIVNGWPLVHNLIAPTDSGYLAMRDYLATQISSDALIETWEWEMSFDARQPMHHPPTSVTNAFTDHLYSNRPLPPDPYDARLAQPRYILQGPFSAWTGIYREPLASDAEQVITLGDYSLYRLRIPQSP